MTWTGLSGTEALYSRLCTGNLLAVDSDGRIHWSAPRSDFDSYPWLSQSGKFRQARRLRAVPGPRWGELRRWARLKGAPGAAVTPGALGWGGGAPLGPGESAWGWRVDAWPSAARRGALQFTGWLVQIDPAGEQHSRHLHDCHPGQMLTAALELGLLEQTEPEMERLAAAFDRAEN